MTTLYRTHAWPVLMVSCCLVEAAAAVAATLTGLLLSNWWIILLLVWPPKAGNARLFLTVYKLLLCYYILWKKNKTAALHWRTCTIYSKNYMQVLLQPCKPPNPFRFFSTTPLVRCGVPTETMEDFESEKRFPSRPPREKLTLSLSQFIQNANV